MILPMSERFVLRNLHEPALAQLAQVFAPALQSGAILYLQGDLGVGKTTFVRLLLQAMGVGERIKSPTYSLIESYAINSIHAHHLDLYRIADAGELEWLGLADLLEPHDLLLIEWPERGQGSLPDADLFLRFNYVKFDTRDINFAAASKNGRDILEHLAKHYLNENKG